MSTNDNQQDTINFCSLHPYRIVKKLPLDSLETFQIDKEDQKIKGKKGFISKILNMLAKIFV